MDTADDLAALFNRQPSGLDFVGPFSSHRVILHGYAVPHLEAHPNADGVHLSLDHRSGIDLSTDEAEKIVPFIADCIAVALGYSCHPNPDCPTPQPMTPFRRTIGIRSLETG